jgi:hypothetical protein
MMRNRSTKPRNPNAVVVAILAFVVALAALSGAGVMGVGAFLSMSGTQMVAAGASALFAAMALMVAIHALRS